MLCPPGDDKQKEDQQRGDEEGKHADVQRALQRIHPVFHRDARAVDRGVIAEQFLREEAFLRVPPALEEIAVKARNADLFQFFFDLVIVRRRIVHGEGAGLVIGLKRGPRGRAVGFLFVNGGGPGRYAENKQRQRKRRKSFQRARKRFLLFRPALCQADDA